MPEPEDGVYHPGDRRGDIVQNDNKLAEAQRRTIFAELVAAQNAGAAVRESRVLVADYGISVDRVREVEREGIGEEWPPLRD